ncbi:nuclear pore complex protein GP210 [Carex littledalei]|uniref:Nuclear pore complex protein GP210 n=1 Tax=Carex littledalei TaxID=544730 RepID=A0A833QKL9_9POAL|nr:nuclear pore complex protein GP210 [Carex littledalei]
MGSVVLAVVVLSAVASWLPAKVVALASPGPHITDLNILLPPRMTNPVEYRLQGSDGCFRWSWDHHDILSVEPEYNATSRCSTSARLVSKSPYVGRKETSVYATDLISGTAIRCKVIIDNISRIQIFHHAVKIDLDELAVLQIRGFDDEDNVFSSLAGLRFLWQLLPKSGKADDKHHLVHVPLKETPLSDCGGFCGDLEMQIEIEDQGLGSDLHVVKGIEIGQEVVSVQLMEPKLEHVVDTIVLTVAEAMSLDPPSPVFVTVGSVIIYRLQIIRLNAAKVVELPSPHHKWYATNHSVILVDSLLGTVQALDIGFSEIVVEDVRISGHIQTSALHVVVPGEIILYLQPMINDSAPFEVVAPINSSLSWYVFPGQEYVVILKAFPARSEANEIYLTEKNEPKLESSTFNYWELSLLPDDHVAATDWHNSRLLTPISEGKGSLTASITYQRDISAPAEVIKLVHEVNVCNKVQLFFDEQTEYSKIVRLPWVPGIFQELKLKPVGGCGRSLTDFKWFSSDESIISISSSGVAYARGPGEATVKAESTYDSLNYDEVVISVSFPKSMVFVPGHPVEAVVGSKLHVAVTLRASNGDHFMRCDAFSSLILWRLSSETESFKIIEKSVDEKHGSPCGWVYLHASAAGRATVAAALTYETRSYSKSSDGPTVLKAATVVSAYYPLVVYQAASGSRYGGYYVNLSETEIEGWITERKGLDELYLVPGSTMDIHLFGGPQRWSPRVEFVDTLHVLEQPDSSTTDAVVVNRLSHQMYRISCERRGDYKLHFSRGNLAGGDHPLPAIESTHLLVVCDIPSSITLIANEPENAIHVIRAASRADRNPGRIQANPIVVSNGQAIRLAAVAIHATDKIFANASSLSLKWELIGCDGLAYLDAVKDVASLEISTWEQFLILQNSTGLCIIRASVLGFSELTIRNLQAKVNSLLLGIGKDDLSDTLELQIMSSLRVTPESIVLVYHPEAKISLSISGGTCFLEAASNDTQVVQIIQHPEGVHCTNLVVGVIGLGTALVAVHDIGLSPSTVASATIKVTNVEWIKIISPEQISLMEGTERNFEILAGTQDGDTFDFSQYMFMDIIVHTDGEVLELIKITNSSGRDARKFSVKAVHLGMTSLYVSARQMSGKRILSEHIEVEVYKRLQLHPEYIYLVPGASYALSVEGGPKLDAVVEYASMNEQAVKLNSTSGRLLANSVGNATIRAIAYTRSGSFICDAIGTVEVGIPSALSLNSQSERMCVGCIMPVFPSFPKGDLFSFYGICQAYSWMIENEEVLKFKSDEEALTEELAYGDKNHAYKNLLVGRSAGKSDVSVSISCDFVNFGRVQRMLYNGSKLVTVVPNPPLALGLPITWLLPPFYSMSRLLPGRGGLTYTMLRPCERNGALIKQEIEETISVKGSCVMTGRNDDLGCIKVKDQGTGREEIAACIRVAKVSQVRIAASTSSVQAAFLAIGDKFELDTLYCDELGYVFAEANGMVPVDIETNYPDILSIFVLKDVNYTEKDRRRFVLQARRPGTALIKMSIGNNPRKSDFLVVSVGAQIYPRDPNLSVGQYVNFNIVGDDSKTWSGKWSSGNESVLTIHKMTGEAHAHGVGTVKVIFESSDLKLETAITVRNVNQVIVGATAETLTNVQFPSDGYKFSVRFSDPKDHKIAATSKLVNVPYDCKVEPAFVGYSKPWTDRFTEKSYCLFFPHPPENLLSFMLDSKVDPESIATKKRSIDISITASVRDDPNVREVVTAPIIGGFSIPGARQVNLSPSSNTSMIIIVGNTDLELTWKFKDLMSVHPVKVVDFGITGQTEYQVQLLKRKPFSDKIVFYLPATGLREEVHVVYEAEKTTGKLTEATIVRKIGIFFTCAALIITVFLFWKCYDRPQRTPPPVNRAGPTPSAPVFAPSTPVRQTGTTIPPSSPQSEPFLDYVRRTVDETPYKRSGRLRYDVQKSY